MARNQVLQYAAQQKDNAFLGTIQQLNLVTSELREGVMKTRMQPISRLFDKVPRVVRDVSLACGKQVHVDTEGKDTELDRTLLEAIAYLLPTWYAMLSIMESRRPTSG